MVGQELTNTKELYSTQVARLNDKFRRQGLGYTLTVGVQQLQDVYGLIDEVRAYDSFTEDNDPYREHDFGSLQWEYKTVFWKIDYYDGDMRCWKNPLVHDCGRVLTVMLASEY